jgi:hypothetical protein
MQHKLCSNDGHRAGVNGPGMGNQKRAERSGHKHVLHRHARIVDQGVDEHPVARDIEAKGSTVDGPSATVKRDIVVGCGWAPACIGHIKSKVHVATRLVRGVVSDGPAVMVTEVAHRELAWTLAVDCGSGSLDQTDELLGSVVMRSAWHVPNGCALVKGDSILKGSQVGVAH